MLICQLSCPPPPSPIAVTPPMHTTVFLCSSFLVIYRFVWDLWEQNMLEANSITLWKWPLPQSIDQGIQVARLPPHAVITFLLLTAIPTASIGSISVFCVSANPKHQKRCFKNSKNEYSSTIHMRKWKNERVITSGGQR